MRTIVFSVLVVALGAAACATSPVPESTVPPPAATACTALAQQAAQRVAAVLSANRACASDADCATVAQGASCFDHCTTSMAHAGDAALRAVVADVDAHECRDFAAQGCKVEVPPCAPPRSVACRAGVCE